MQARGVTDVMRELRDTLESRYAANPASIVVKRGGQNQMIQLPQTWGVFEALRLTPEEGEAARKAYYAHKDHTAWRYILKPNPWMHERASYVCVNPARTQEKWSTFDEYLELITILYLAAKDLEIAPTDGYTPETRLEQFIAELALIGRAHNWDNSRAVRDAQGRSRQEEYDDLGGDRPSCYSGTLRRLFQSVLGHPLLKILTTEILAQEIASFVYNVFSIRFEGMSDEAHRVIKSAWDKLTAIEDLSEAEQAALKTLDILPEQQRAFIQELAERWGEQFSTDGSYIQQVEQTFVLAADGYHLSTFDYIHPENLFRITPAADVSASVASAATNRAGFFAAISGTSSLVTQEAITTPMSAQGARVT